LTDVLLTPHCAGGSIEAVVAMTDRCVDNILAVRNGRRLGEDLLNPAALAG
jgi:lactate dehydrogenase-like 2-hydroxyacid dehydrogenase